MGDAGRCLYMKVEGKDMKRIRSLFLLVLILASLCGCMRQGLAASLSDAYLQAFKFLFAQSANLNGDITYVAIDLDKLQGIGASEKESITSSFEQMGYTVKDASLQDLMDQGEFDQGLRRGVLLNIEEYKKISDTEIIFSAVKYRSPKSAVWYDIRLEQAGGQWAMVDQTFTMTS